MTTTSTTYFHLVQMTETGPKTACSISFTTIDEAREHRDKMLAGRGQTPIRIARCAPRDVGHGWTNLNPSDYID